MCYCFKEAIKLFHLIKNYGFLSNCFLIIDDGTWNLFLFHCSFPLNLKQAKLESSSTTAVGGYSNGAAAAKKQQSTSTAVAPSAVLTEPPEYLRRLLLTLVKTFYGLECFVVFEYIMKRVILKEEELRDVCKIDQRQLRKFLVTLKVDKFIKERLVPGEVDGRVRKFTYYFVNYKGALNVTKYKVDHIRQKLEVREKDDVHRAYYRCVNDLCRRQYDAMDMGKIFDPFTQEMRCWQCKNVVEQDVSGGPSQVTRSSMANFNEQMTAIFSLLKQLDGVRFGREIMEPAIQASIPRMEGETIELERKVINLGQRAFSTAGKSRSDLYGGEITVSIGDDSLEKAPQAKAEIPWLLASRQNLADEQLQSASTAQSLQSLTVETTETDGSITFEHSQSVVAANSATAFPQKEAASVEEPLPKRQRRDEIASLLADEVRESESVVEANEEDREEEEEEGNLEQRSERIEKQDEEEDTEAKEADPGDFVLVQGERVHIDDIDEQKLAQMSEREKTDYYERMQGAYEDFY